MAINDEIPYPYVKSMRRNGGERFILDHQSLAVDLLSFWQWSSSNLLGNTMRGCLAEYIVATALGIAAGVRNDWEAYDLLFNGWKIEVKASGYVQAWQQKRPSRPVFSIRSARRWDPISGQMTNDPCRQSDLYVFCLHHHKDKETANPLDLSQWSFYILPTVRLNDSVQFVKAKTVALDSLLTLKPSCASFNDLAQSISDVMNK